jgi:hypothetical protein
MRTQTVRLPINGTGFSSKTKIEAFFTPEIDPSKLEVLAHTEGVLLVRLLAGGAWRTDAGPLILRSINTGGGPWKVNGDYGIQVAMVVENNGPSVVLEPWLTGTGGVVLGSEARLYQSSPKLSIWGEGFEDDNYIRFANGLEKAADYTHKVVDLGGGKTRIDMELKRGSKWRAQPGRLKAMALIDELHASKAYTFTKGHLLNGDRGIGVAEILEDPSVQENKGVLDRTHGDLLVIKGSGFSQAELGATKLTFDPELEMGFDYDMKVQDRKTLHLTLKTGRAWRAEAGVLMVTKVDCGAGEFAVGNVVVATVQEDAYENHEALKILLPGRQFARVIPTPDQLVYQYQSDKCLKVRGSGFTEMMRLEFIPPVNPNTYDQEYLSDTELCLTLKVGEKWADGDATLKVLSVSSYKDTPLKVGSDTGVAVAKIQLDPHVETATKDAYQSFTKRITIRGSGFDEATQLGFSPPLILRTPEYGEYEYVDVQPTFIVIALVNDARWIRAPLEPGDRVPLKVRSVTTAAGIVGFSPAITVAEIISDPEHVLCTDSCDFANNNICDDARKEDTTNDGLYRFADDDDYNYALAHDDDYQLYDDDEWYQLVQVTSDCEWGTDCSDCGPREELEAIVCTNTCGSARDGACDDERTTRACELGTDCQDCGPVGASNFSVEDYGDDDAVYWEEIESLGKDDDLIEWKDDRRVKRAEQHKKNLAPASSPGFGALLVDVLMGLVYLVFVVVVAGASTVVYKVYKGEGEAISLHIHALLESNHKSA